MISHRPALRAGAVAVAILVCAALVATPAAARPATERWVVAVTEGVDPAAVAAEVGASDVRLFRNVAGFAADITSERGAALSGDPRVVAAQPDEVVVTRVEPRATRRPPAPSDQVVPVGIRRVGATESRTARIDGRDQRVNADIAVLDAGVDLHPELVVVSRVDCTGEGIVEDTDGHGTEVAGVAAAIDNRTGVVGVAPGARIWSIRVFDSAGAATAESLMCGMNELRRNTGRIDVANLSFGDDETPPAGTCGRRVGRGPSAGPRIADPFHAAVCRVVAAGTTIVAAAGNEATAAYRVPAGYPEVLSVSAFNDTDGRRGGRGDSPPCYYGEADDTFTSFSNFGPAVDVAAPGSCVVTTFPGNLYVVVDGTSVAAPHVAGAAALLHDRSPGVSPAQVRSRLLNRAEPGPVRGDPDRFPEPVLDVRGL